MTKAPAAGKTYHGGELTQYYHGAGRRGPISRGCFKHRPRTARCDLIPTLHIGADGARTASLRWSPMRGAGGCLLQQRRCEPAEGLFQIGWTGTS